MSEMELLRRLARHARDRGDDAAYRFVGAAEVSRKEISWRHLHSAVQFHAGKFAEKLQAGETLLISSPNRIEVVVAILAGFAAGLRVFPVSADLSETELFSHVKQANVAGVIGTARVVGATGAKVRQVWNIDEINRDGDDLFSRSAGDLILQSSGTTGYPRLVLRSGRSVDAVSSAMVLSIGFGPDDRVLMTLPLSHSYGLEHGILAPVWAGSTVLLAQGLDVGVVARELADGATIFPTVPSVIEILADLPADSCPMPCLRQIYSAGGPLPRSVFSRFHARYGRRVSQLYGATEVGSVTFSSAGNSHFDPASVGVAMQGVSVRIVDQIQPETILSNGREGQVAIRADSMFERYVDDLPTQLLDGYFPTGDLGTLDGAGRLTITGRLKLLIDVGGVKVNPLEVESVLREHPDVSQCVVVPVRQSETVFRIKAIATPRDPSRPPTIEALRQLARKHLATYKIPRTIEIRASLPTTATGKVLRHLVETS
jgi:acyl-CoA synthetase (AMP-forming)/AMP-acid ligase II